MNTHTSEVVVDRTRDIVFDRLSRFDVYPQFMDSVDEVAPLGPDRMRWTMSLGPVTRVVEAELTTRSPNELIAWTATGDGIKEAGEIRLLDAGPGRTTVRMSVAYDLGDGLLVRAAEAVGLLERKLSTELDNLKSLIESDEDELPDEDS